MWNKNMYSSNLWRKEGKRLSASSHQRINKQSLYQRLQSQIDSRKEKHFHQININKKIELHPKKYYIEQTSQNICTWTSQKEIFRKSQQNILPDQVSAALSLI